MAERQISVLMESRYQSDLSKRLRQDKQKIDAFRKHLERRPLNIPVKLDLRGAMTQAQALRKAILGEFAKMPASILGADGRPASAPASSGKQMNAKAGLLSTTEFSRYDAKNKKWVTDQITQVEQLGKGITQLSKFKGDASEPFATITKDVSNVKSLADQLRTVNAELGKVQAAARGRGDKAGQIQALKSQASNINSVLQSAAGKGLENSPVYGKAEDQLSRIQQRIAGLEGGQDSEAARQARKDRTRDIANQITAEERRVQQALKANKLDMDASERIKDKAVREAEVNRLYDERKKIFDESRDRFRAMDKSLQGEGRNDLADRAMRRGLGMNSQADQAVLDKQRAETDRMRADDKERERMAKEAQRRADKAQKIADQAAAKSGKRGFSRAMRMDDYNTKLQLAQNRADEAAARAIPDRAAREAELNRVLSERSRIYQDQAARLGTVQRGQAAAGNDDNALKAESARLKAIENAANVGVDQAKVKGDAMRSVQQKAAADQTAAFQREMQNIKARSDQRLAQINATEKREVAAARSKAAKIRAAENAHYDRMNEYGGRANAYAGVQQRATQVGNDPVASAARGKRLASVVAGERDMIRFAAATAKSGHALDFHSSSLIRNAGTFLKWQIPMLAVMKSVQAFNAGFSGAMKIDRQFATLRAVFRGTDEEVQKLKEDTLDLAMAQGRASDEAMDAAIRWSRLGLNRVQVNEAVRTSLMAANVAEITAAEAAEKLSAIYATYRLNVGDLPVVLSRLNAISNRYNVTNKDLLEGIVRVAGVAKQAGMELRDLEGIIGAVTGATGRPGQEVGNALKFVITRLASPDTIAGLKKGFDLDLVGPNGDLKDMSQIFRELADIYPTLNNAQKQYFLKLTAGSRQAARFALILDQYRQSQILAAEAGFDTSSAFQENQKILESLQSKVDSLKASWIALFTAMADAGAFDWFAERARYLQALIMVLDRKINDAKPQGDRSYTINDPLMAETVESIGGGENKIWGTRDKFNKEEIKETIKQIEAAIKLREEYLSGKSKGKNFTGPANSKKVIYAGGKGSFKSMEEAKKAVEVMKMLLEDGGDTGAQDRIAAMTSEVDRLRERMGSVQRAANVFDSLAAGISNGSVATKTMVRDFENGAHLLLQMEDGARLYGETLQKFYTLADAGDNDAIAKLAEDIADLFRVDMEGGADRLKKAMDPAVDSLREELSLLEKKRREINSMPASTNQEQRDKQNRIEANESDAKAAIQKIQQLTQATEEFKKSAYGFEQTTNINRFFDDLLGQKGDNDLTGQAKAVMDSFKDFSPDPDGDPVSRTFQRRRNAVGIQLRWLKDIRRETVRLAGEEKAAAQSKLNQAQNVIDDSTSTFPEEKAARKQVEAQTRIINQQDEAVQTIETKIRLQEEEVALAIRKLEYEERIAVVLRTQKDAERRADNSSQAWRFGETDSDKDGNQAQAAIERSRRGLDQADALWWNGDNTTAKAGLSGQILQDEATARANLETMERRQYEIDAARKQVAIDTAKAMREQTEEASKRLALASREDQLRAAALARTIRDKGPLGDSEFFALSQETRQVASTYLPNDVPDFLNDAVAAAAKTYRELNEEQSRIVSLVPEIRGALEQLTERINRAGMEGGSLDILPSPPPKSVQDASRESNPVVNLNLGDVSVLVSVNEQINRMLTEYVDRKLNADLAAMERRINRPPPPNAYGVVE